MLALSRPSSSSSPAEAEYEGRLSDAEITGGRLVPLSPHIKKLPPAGVERCTGRFTKRAPGKPFEMVSVLMPPGLREAVKEVARRGRLRPATIWRRAAILGLPAALQEVEAGIDLSRE
jgi:hypothetical protein